MTEKKLLKLQKKINVLENMLEEKTRNLFMAKEEIEKKSIFIQAVVNSVNDMIISINPNGHIELINRPAINKLKVDDEGDKLDIRKVLGDDLVDKLIEEEKKNNNQTEHTIQLKDDTSFPVLVSRTQLSQEKEVDKGLVYSIIDMTMLKEKEKIIEGQRAQLVQNTQLASLGEMASGIAHEINNPVTVMDGQMRRLKDYLSDDEISLEKKEQLVDKLQANLGRIVKIVAGIRKISRKGEADNLGDIRLAPVMQSLKNLCNEKFRNNQVKINFPQIDEQLAIMAKETQLLQALMNLVTNSSDAIENLEKKWIAIDVFEENQLVKIRVSDSGCGIEENTLEKIFNPFFTTKDIGKGTGIGLSISKKMIEEQGGTLEYELFEGNTSFVISLKAFQENLMKKAN